MNIKRLSAAAAAALLVLTMTSCKGSGDKLAVDGKKLYMNGSYSEALDSFLTAEDRGLKNFREHELYNCIGNCYLKLEDYENALEYHKKCVDIAPEYFEGLVNLGISYRKNGDREKALECYQKALELDPENGDSAPLYVNLGSLYIEFNKPISAIEYLEKAKALYKEDSAQNADIYAFLSIAYAMALEPEKSDSAYTKAAELGYPHLDEVNAQLDKLASR
ncbi:MAG: tetratricopeptide repeat protein [Oscillospiraceae bacterium]|nr:tetratricopeptide repeat protein [Oscillospiraceae bacterium]